MVRLLMARPFMDYGLDGETSDGEAFYLEVFESKTSGWGGACVLPGRPVRRACCSPDPALPQDRPHPNAKHTRKTTTQFMQTERKGP